MNVFQSIPVVDISPLRGGDQKAHAEAIARIRDASESIGFFYVTGHGIPKEAFSDLQSVAKRFFALSQPEKMRVYIGNSRNHRGYVPEGEEVFAGGTPDKKEAFDLAIDLRPDDPDYIAGNPLLGPNQWPPDVPGFREAVASYYDEAFKLGRLLLRGFAQALDLEPGFFERFVTKPTSQLRLLHYPYQPDNRDRPGIGSHTDYEIFTLLFPTAPGLEVMNGEGKWVDAPPIDGALVVNIGDMLEVWSNGKFSATSHRVRRVTEERYSFPFFFSCDYATRVEPLAQFIAADRPSAYQPVMAGDHLFAQTAQTFKYLRERRERGELKLPEGSLGLSSFGREARQAAPTTK